MKPKPELTADDPRFQYAIENVKRLRQMLTLMAPETGSSALGAARKGFGKTRVDLHLPALTDQHH
jgi:hypothetical protein